MTTFRSERAFGVAAARVSLETFSHHPTETTSLDAQSRARAGGDMTEGLALEREGDALLTSGLWNRRRDLRAVRRHLGTEFGFDPADVEVRCARTDAVLATGYRRVLLGDHGPYLELDPEAVRWENLRRVHAGDARFYDEWRVAVGRGGGDDAVSTPENARSRSARADDDVAKLYHQIKPVTGQRNPPRDTAWAVANNRPEAEGYAAYVPGRVYVGAFDARVRGRAMPTPRGAVAVGDDGAAPRLRATRGGSPGGAPRKGAAGSCPRASRACATPRMGSGTRTKRAKKAKSPCSGKTSGSAPPRWFPAKASGSRNRSTRSTGPPVLRSTVPPIPLTKAQPRRMGCLPLRRRSAAPRA